MNTCALSQNLGNIILQYILILAKSEKLHTKLENLYFKSKNKTGISFKNQIFRINNNLNKLLVQIMNYQWIIELLTATQFN